MAKYKSQNQTSKAYFENTKICEFLFVKSSQKPKQIAGVKLFLVKHVKVPSFYNQPTRMIGP